MSFNFLDVADFVYHLERTGRDADPVILDDNEPDDECLRVVDNEFDHALG